MMRIIYILVFTALSISIYAQQLRQYTQYVYNPTLYNPSEVVSEDYLRVVGNIRTQWAGLEGAPSTQSVGILMPVDSMNIGLGLQLLRSTIGIQEKLDATLLYAYKLHLNKSTTLSLGLQMSFRRFTNDFTDPRLIALDGIVADPAVDNMILTKTVLNGGVGFRFQKDKTYVGASVPRIIKSSIDAEEADFVAREIRHLYISAGSEFRINANWQFQPNALVKFTEKNTIGSGSLDGIRL